jgi:VanZ family protein
LAKGRVLTTGLGAFYLVVLVYASLYPFEGWSWPAGADWRELLFLDWPPWRNRFDEWTNVLGYAPLGMLLFLTLTGRGWPLSAALLATTAAGAGLSYAMEFSQHFIPGRFPSARDWVNNAAGCAAGAAVAWFALGAGWAEVSSRWRDRWFVPRSALAILLLTLWPMGLLFPAPVPLGLGHVGPELRSMVEAAVTATPLEQPARDVLAAVRSTDRPLSPWREALLVGLGLAAPCLLACVVTRPGWKRRVWVAPIVLLVAIGVTSMSTALNFGPDHAWAWATQVSLQAMVMAALICMGLSTAGPRLTAALALVVLTALIAVVAEAPHDPYYSASLSGWEQGRFVRFHGLAQWIGLLWPFAAMAWLLSRLARRD